MKQILVQAISSSSRFLTLCYYRLLGFESSSWAINFVLTDLWPQTYICSRLSLSLVIGRSTYLLVPPHSTGHLIPNPLILVLTLTTNLILPVMRSTASIEISVLSGSIPAVRRRASLYIHSCTSSWKVLGHYDHCDRLICRTRIFYPDHYTI